MGGAWVDLGLDLGLSGVRRSGAIWGGCVVYVRTRVYLGWMSVSLSHLSFLPMLHFHPSRLLSRLPARWLARPSATAFVRLCFAFLAPVAFSTSLAGAFRHGLRVQGSSFSARCSLYTLNSGFARLARPGLLFLFFFCCTMSGVRCLAGGCRRGRGGCFLFSPSRLFVVHTFHI